MNDILNNEVITESVLEYMKAKPLNGEAIKLGVEIFNKIIALIGDELEEPPAVVSKLTNSIGLFTQVLQDSECLGPNPSVVLTTGPLKHGFGFVRLAVLDLLVSLLYTGFPVVVEGMLQENVFPTILNLLFDYPWNNIAHQRIVMLYSGLFCCNNFDSIQTVRFIFSFSFIQLICFLTRFSIFRYSLSLCCLKELQKHTKLQRKD